MGVRKEGIGGYYSVCWRPGETEPNAVESVWRYARPQEAGWEGRSGAPGKGMRLDQRPHN